MLAWSGMYLEFHGYRDNINLIVCNLTMGPTGQCLLTLRRLHSGVSLLLIMIINTKKQLTVLVFWCDGILSQMWHHGTHYDVYKF